MSQYFPLYGGSSESIKVELDLSNYATKTDVKNLTHVNVSNFVSKTNLAALKAEDDKIDTDKLKTGDDSYLFVNGKQELKLKCKTEHLVKEKLCLGNLSDQWTASESEKTGLYGNIYDFAVDYEQIIGVRPIYDFHRYLMIKHNISP